MCQKRPCKRAALSMGALLGHLEGVVYWDFRQRKGMHISVPLPWTQKTLKVTFGSHLELQQGKGSTELITDYGAQRAPYITFRCIGTVRDLPQMLISTTQISIPPCLLLLRQRDRSPPHFCFCCVSPDWCLQCLLVILSVSLSFSPVYTSVPERKQIFYCRNNAISDMKARTVLATCMTLPLLNANVLAAIQKINYRPIRHNYQCLDRICTDLVFF